MVPGLARVRKSEEKATQAPDLKPLTKRSNAEEVNRGIMEAFFSTRQGFPVDRVIADPELNEEFVGICGRLGLPGRAFDWNQRLMNLRKAGHLKGIPHSLRTTFPLEDRQFYRYKFACEIAIQTFEQAGKTTLDQVLCDPEMARDFDQYVRKMLPDPDQPTSLMIRWFALRIRKAAHQISQASAKLGSVIEISRDRENPFSLNCSKVPESPGLYWLHDKSNHLYVGETDNLRERMEIQFGHKKFDFWKASLGELQVAYKTVDVPDGVLPRHQSRWISSWSPIGNYAKLAASK